jgi:peptidyl-prolyl cis-trans isomerase D
MLKALRQHAKYFYFLFVLVILAFIFWMPGTIEQNSALQAVAEIGDEKITTQEYWRAYDNMADLYREVYREQFDAEAMDLKGIVLSTLIEERLLLIAAQEAGVTVTDEELQEAIVNNPTFMRDGGFDKDIYLRALQLSRITPVAYEESKRRELMLSRMRRIIESTVALTPQEVAALSEDEETYKSLRETLLDAKRSQAVRSFINGLQKRVPLKVNEQLIS